MNKTVAEDAGSSQVPDITRKKLVGRLRSRLQNSIALIFRNPLSIYILKYYQDYHPHMIISEGKAYL